MLSHPTPSKNVRARGNWNGTQTLPSGRVWARGKCKKIYWRCQEQL